MKTDSSSVVQNLSASRMRIVGTCGALRWQCTLGSFIATNPELRAASYRGFRGVFGIANQIRVLGSITINLGRAGIFTLRAE